MSQATMYIGFDRASESMCCMFIVGRVDLIFIRWHVVMNYWRFKLSWFHLLYLPMPLVTTSLPPIIHGSLKKYHPQKMVISSIQLAIVEFKFDLIFDDWAFFCSKWLRNGEGPLTCATTLDNSKATCIWTFQTKVYILSMMKYVTPLSHYS